MLLPCPISASPIYERWGTFAPSPRLEFFISTNVPAFARGPSTRAGAQIAERPDQSLVADLGVDDHRVRADDGAAPDRGRAAQHRERLDLRVGLDGHVGLDERRRRIDDASRRPACGRWLIRSRSTAVASARSTRVLMPWAIRRIGVPVGDDASGPASDQQPDDVGQVQLALVVVGGQPPQRRPQLCGVERVDPRVDLGQLALLRRSRRAPRRSAGPSRRRRARCGRSRRRCGGRARSSAPQPPRPRRGAPRAARVSGSGSSSARVGVDDKDVALEPFQAPRRTADRVTGAARLRLHDRRRRLGQQLGDLRRVRRHHHHGRLGPSGATASSTHSSSGRPHAGCSTLGTEERIRVPSPPARIRQASDAICHREGREAEAGAPGFEPGITGPKPVALPLGHAPPAASGAASIGQSRGCTAVV